MSGFQQIVVGGVGGEWVEEIKSYWVESPRGETLLCKPHQYSHQIELLDAKIPWDPGNA